MLLTRYKNSFIGFSFGILSLVVKRLRFWSEGQLMQPGNQ
jgi:hypothetical protein